MQKLKTQTKGGAPVLVLCLVVMFILAAVMAAGASAALPEFGGCEAAPAHEGKYADSNCTVPVKPLYGKYSGEYEWYTEAAFHGGHPKLKGYNFGGGEIGPTTFETTTGKQITCPVGELYQLQIESSKDVGEILTFFYGCESEGEPCRSEFHGEGLITDESEWEVAEGLKGELVYLSGKNTLTPVVGLTLTAFKPGAPLFTVVCSSGQIGSLEIGGAGGAKREKAKGNTVLSLIDPIDQMTRDYTQTFSQTAGVQEPLKAQKGKATSLQMFLSNANKWVQLGFATSWTLPSEIRAPVEIKAVK